jgi:hypothetical protein
MELVELVERKAMSVWVAVWGVGSWATYIPTPDAMAMALKTDHDTPIPLMMTAGSKGAPDGGRKQIMRANGGSFPLQSMNERSPSSRMS